jgi:NAD+ diphosphatase
VVFLGLDETNHAHALTNKSTRENELPDLDLALAQFSTPDAATTMMERLPGTPYFALEVGGLAEEDTKALLERAVGERREGGEDLSVEFAEPRSAASAFSDFDAGVLAEARAMLDWNTRNKVSVKRINVLA